MPPKAAKPSTIPALALTLARRPEPFGEPEPVDEGSEAPEESKLVADMDEPEEAVSWAGYAELGGLISNDSEVA
jgi:hypothetical protein